MGAWGVECRAASSVELLQLQKATAGFGHLETQSWGGRQVKTECRGAGRACVQCTTVRGSKARGGGCMQGKPTCLLVFAAESPWDAFTVLTVCPAGWGLHSDSRATWSKTLKTTFKGKNCAMCTFLMQRLSPRGFGDCSVRAPGALPGNSSARATRPQPCVLAVTGAEPCWESAQRLWEHCPAALEPLCVTALHQAAAPQEPLLTLSPSGPLHCPSHLD